MIMRRWSSRVIRDICHDVHLPHSDQLIDGTMIEVSGCDLFTAQTGKLEECEKLAVTGRAPVCRLKVIKTTEDLEMRLSTIWVHLIESLIFSCCVPKGIFC